MNSPDSDDHSGHDHDHSGHNHGPSTEVVRIAGVRRVVFALSANAALLVAQVIGALAAGSLALLADSAHQASDVFGLSIALVAVIVARRPATDTYTYGLRQADVLGGALIGLLLCGSSIYIVFEAIQRFRDVEPVRGGLVIVLAFLGIAVNGGAALALAGGHNTPGRPPCPPCS